MRKTGLLPPPRAIFIILCSCMWWVCGILFKTLKQPMKEVLWLYSSEKNGETADVQQWE